MARRLPVDRMTEVGIGLYQPVGHRGDLDAIEQQVGVTVSAQSGLAILSVVFAGNARLLTPAMRTATAWPEPIPMRDHLGPDLPNHRILTVGKTHLLAKLRPTARIPRRLFAADILWRKALAATVLAAIAWAGVFWVISADLFSFREAV